MILAIQCDKCRTVFKPEDGVLKIVDEDADTELHLCPDCAGTLMAWMRWEE